MRVLVTGVTGFAGGHVAEALLAEGGVELFGVSRGSTWPAKWAHLDGKVQLVHCDLCDLAEVRDVLALARPECIYHLAGYADVAASFAHPDQAWAGNLTATRTLYDAVVSWRGKPRILYVGSGLVYGDAQAGERPFTEDAALYPASPYAASKAAADLLSYQVHRAPGLDIVRARPFNHIGPRQAPQFAVAHFAQQIAAAEQGRRPPLVETGNLSARRDLSDVRDVACAYVLLLRHGRAGEVYNVASERVYAMSDVLEALLRLARIKVEARRQEHLLRPVDTRATRASATKLRDETGWRPLFTLEQTLADTLDYWRRAPGEAA